MPVAGNVPPVSCRRRTTALSLPRVATIWSTSSACTPRAIKSRCREAAGVPRQPMRPRRRAHQAFQRHRPELRHRRRPGLGDSARVRGAAILGRLLHRRAGRDLHYRPGRCGHPVALGKNVGGHDRARPLVLGNVAERQQQAVPLDADSGEPDAGPGVEPAVEKLELGWSGGALVQGALEHGGFGRSQALRVWHGTPRRSYP